jgi:serine/threonine protein kinase
MKLGLCPVAPDTSERGANERQAPVDGELRPGDVLDGRFAITEMLCRSGMATIFRAQDLHSGDKPVVLKVPHKLAEIDPALFSRFQREEEIGGKLNHPSVVKFVPVYGEKSRPYIVTEYLSGRTLFHKLRDCQMLPEKDALALASRICEVLEYLHSRGIIHRDLKPENIMLCDDGGIRIMDFGIARAVGTRRLTFIGFAPGTPNYMAPERVKCKRGDERTDIYGLGAILYEMLTGTIPFDDDDILVIMNARVTGDPEAPRKLNPKLSPQAEEIVLRAMDRNPANRHQTAASLKKELDAPEQVEVTDRSRLLKVSTPWKRGLRKIRQIAMCCLVPPAILVMAFFLLWHHYAKK